MSDDRETQGGDGSRDEHHRAKQGPNVKPRPNYKEKTSKKEQGKKERPAKVRRSRSNDLEGDRGRRRERERHPGERTGRGRSEEARRRDRKEGESQQRKPHHAEDDLGDTECVVCFCSYDNVFKTPKLLACGHTFCLECLARINVSSVELKSLSCPVCREMTDLPHGRDLPHLGTNQDIFRRLPPEMQRALSIRFQRNKGKLVLKNPPPSSPTNSSTLTLPTKKQSDPFIAGGGVHMGSMEEGMAPTTMVDVGRPPNRVRGRLRRMFRSDQCYYIVVAAIITITVALMLVGILAFVIMPNVMVHKRPPVPNNQTHGQPVNGIYVHPGTEP
ncbi:E3 ubiquitin-protein ligase RNF183 [Diretmus argenteus]